MPATARIAPGGAGCGSVSRDRRPGSAGSTRSSTRPSWTRRAAQAGLGPTRGGHSGSRRMTAMRCWVLRPRRALLDDVLGAAQLFDDGAVPPCRCGTDRAGRTTHGIAHGRSMPPRRPPRPTDRSSSASGATQLGLRGAATDGRRPELWSPPRCWPTQGGTRSSVIARERLGEDPGPLLPYVRPPAPTATSANLRNTEDSTSTRSDGGRRRGLGWSAPAA